MDDMEDRPHTTLALCIWEDGSVDLVQRHHPTGDGWGPSGMEHRRRLSPDVAADLMLVLLDEACRR